MALRIMAMRIIGGSHRGRRLTGIAGAAIRPTSDRARQAIFNILEHGPPAQAGLRLEGAVVLDAFAGTGAFGIEALSRGAAHATFIDNAKPALDATTENLTTLGMTEQATVVRGDATAPPGAVRPCNLAFLDPPYDEDIAGDALAALARAGWLTDKAWCCVEHEVKNTFEVPGEFECIDTRRYGRAAIACLIWHG